MAVARTSSSVPSGAGPAVPEVSPLAGGGWPAGHGEAWIGLLETHKRVTRALDAELDERYGLTLSGLELLGRLAVAPERCLRLSSLAAEAGLSLSRVSRIAVLLERRGLIDREPCPADARAVEARLTAEGLALVGRAQRTHVALVQRLFLNELDEEELAVLAGVFSRLSPRAARRCAE